MFQEMKVSVKNMIMLMQKLFSNCGSNAMKLCDEVAQTQSKYVWMMWSMALHAYRCRVALNSDRNDHGVITYEGTCYAQL